MKKYIIFSLTLCLGALLSVFGHAGAEAANYPRFERQLTEHVFVVSVGKYTCVDAVYLDTHFSLKAISNSRFRLSNKKSFLHPENLSLTECSRFKDNPGRNGHYGASSKYYQRGESLISL